MTEAGCASARKPSARRALRRKRIRSKVVRPGRPLEEADFDKAPDRDGRTDVAVGDTALVLHGGSGVPDELMKEAIRNGIAKINFGTELKNAFTLAVRKSLLSSDDIDLRRTFAPAIKAVEEVSKSKIRICGT